MQFLDTFRDGRQRGLAATLAVTLAAANGCHKG